jgi:hypothetical protein
MEPGMVGVGGGGELGNAEAHFVLLLRITSSPPARPQHGFNMHFFIIYMDSKRILSIIATRRKQVIYIYIYI